jgi:hypothetical protein
MRLDAAADHHVGLAGHDLRRGRVDRLEAGGAEAVELLAGHVLGVAGVERRDARDVRALLADRRDAAEDHVVEQRGVQFVAVAQRASTWVARLIGVISCSAPFRLAAAARGADVVAVARRVAQLAASMPPGAQDDGGVAFWTSGDPAVLAGPLSRLWGAPVTLAALPAEYAGRGA